MTEYVLGFLVDHESDRVLLTLKTHPDWQCGYWNGIGGHVEPGETFLAAMIREAEEETGAPALRQWRRFATMVGESAKGPWCCAVFTAERPDDFEPPRANDVGERFGWWFKNELRELPIIDNLAWLVPMAFSKRITLATIAETPREALDGTPPAAATQETR